MICYGKVVTCNKRKPEENKIVSDITGLSSERFFTRCSRRKSHAKTVDMGRQISNFAIAQSSRLILYLVLIFNLTKKLQTLGHWTDLLNTHLFDCSLLKHSGGQRVEIGDGIGIIGFGQVQTDILQSFALNQVIVILVREEGRPHTSDQGFRKSMANVKGGEITISLNRLRGRHGDDVYEQYEA